MVQYFNFTYKIIILLIQYIYSSTIVEDQEDDSINISFFGAYPEEKEIVVRLTCPMLAIRDIYSIVIYRKIDFTISDRNIKYIYDENFTGLLKIGEVKSHKRIGMCHNIESTFENISEEDCAWLSWNTTIKNLYCTVKYSKTDTENGGVLLLRMEILREIPSSDQLIVFKSLSTFILDEIKNISEKPFPRLRRMVVYRD